MTIYRDTRLGGIQKWYIGMPKDALMRVPDDILRCVCFLCVKETKDGSDRFHYGGTGFFVSLPSESQPDTSHIYVVTAAHNIEKAQRYGSNLYLRVNTLTGEAKHVEVEQPWTFPEKNGVDLAILGWAPPSSIFHFRTISIESCATEAVFEKEDIGLGDELFCVGLFTQRHGTKKNQPIVRSGIIAAMPSEPLEDTDTRFEYDAYLAEVRSIGGLSGSPVFVGLPDVFHTATIKRAREKLFYLLGVIRGHWDLKKRETALDFADDELDQVNMGIALVTPIGELITMLNSDELKKQRRKSEEVFAKQKAPTLDSGFPERSFTKDDFESALKKASRKITPEGKKKT